MATTGDPWHDLWAPLGAIAAIALVATAWYLGWLGEVATAVILVLAVVGVAFVAPLIVAELALPSSLDRALYALVALGSAAIFMAEAGVQLFPGEPLATLAFDGQVREQALQRPDGGALRVIARADMAHQASSRLAYRVILKSAGDRQPIEGAFSRRSSGGGAGGVTALHSALSHLVPLGGGAGPVTLTVAAWESPTTKLYLDVYPARCPHRWLLGLQIGLLALALVVRRRIGRVTTRIWLVPSALFATLLAIYLPGALTPAEPVMPLFGMIVLSGVGGALGGEFLGWVVLRGRSAL